MKVCQRCGDQAEDWWTLYISTHRNLGSSGPADFNQHFNVCEDCRQQVFNALSEVFTNSPEWDAPELSEAGQFPAATP